MFLLVDYVEEGREAKSKNIILAFHFSQKDMLPEMLLDQRIESVQ